MLMKTKNKKSTNLVKGAKTVKASSWLALNPLVKKYRILENGVHPLFLNRWSARAMNGKNLEMKELLPLFEAARWAPSSFNNQHWKFLYATRKSKEWKTFLHLLGEKNQFWCKNAGALIVIISKKTFDQDNSLALTHSFDTGAAWENLALQAIINGLVVHAMQGFDYGRTREALDVPEGYSVEAMVAVGKPGKKEDLPKELQEREFPSGRKKLCDMIIEGKFN